VNISSEDSDHSKYFIAYSVIVTGHADKATKTYGENRPRNGKKEGNGTGLGTCCKAMTTTLQNKLCSGHHEVTEDEGDQRTIWKRDLESEMWAGVKYSWT